MKTYEIFHCSMLKKRFITLFLLFITLVYRKTRCYIAINLFTNVIYIFSKTKEMINNKINNYSRECFLFMLYRFLIVFQYIYTVQVFSSRFPSYI